MHGNRVSTNSSLSTGTTLNESTKKLFEAIDKENLENFKQALAESADVNAFDEGYTPLRTIIMNNDDRPIYLKMMILLLQYRDLDVNIQEDKECNTALHMAFLIENKNFTQILLRHPNLDLGIRNNYNDRYGMNRSYTPKGYIEQTGIEQRKDFSHLTIEIEKAQKGKDLLNVLDRRNIYQAKRLLNEELNPNCWKRTQSEEIETPFSLIINSCLQGITPDKKEVLTKLLKHKELDFSQIKPIQAIEQNSSVKQIIKQAITERLTATINKKDLDDVKKLVEDNCFMSHAIVTAALRDASEPTESIKNYLNEKFPTSAEQPVANTHNVQPEINDEFIARELQQLENFRHELERTKAQLIEKERELNRIVCERTGDTNKISQLERDLVQVRQEKSAQKTKINDLNSKVTQLNRIVCGRASDTVEILQLKRDLKQVREERDRLSSENRLLRTKSLNNKNKKPSQAISPGKKQSNCASASFVLSGAFAVGACLAVLYDYLVIGACLAAVILVLLLVGCYSLYRANTILSDVKSTQLGDLERS